MRQFSVTMSDGAVIRGIRTGNLEGQTLMFSNSLGTKHHMWLKQVTDFEQDYDLVLYDTRGHGASSVPDGAYSIARLSLDVIELIDGLELEKIHFCGLSLGGMVAQSLAVRAPERLRSVTLAATSAYIGPPSNWQVRINKVRADGMASIAGTVCKNWFSPQGRAQATDMADALDWLKGTDPRGYAGCCAAIRDMDLRPLVPTIRVPTLILSGENDPATPPIHAKFLCDQIPNARLEIFAGAHLLNLEQPWLFTQILHQFLMDQKGI